jgi:hypothetical protein
MPAFRNSALPLLLVLWSCVLVPALRAQAPVGESAAERTDIGWQWIEQFAGSSSTEGQILALTSSAGYNFSSHVGLITGIPVYFVHNPSSTVGTTSVNGIGDVFVGLRLSFSNPVVNYRMALTGTAPSGDRSKGLSTGHGTYDWTNHFDRKFGRLMPFADLGLANSVPNTLFFQQFTSLGHLMHFEGGTGLDLFGPLSASASFYEIAPWGSQQVFSRLVTTGGLPAGAGSHGRVYEVSQQTSGGSGLTGDHGFNIGLDARVPLFDIFAGFTRSIHYDLNVFSFGVGVNMRNLLHRAKGV